MTDPLQVIDNIAATSSKKDKVSILQSHSDNELVRWAFYLAYEPMIRFHIKQLPNIDPPAEHKTIFDQERPVIALQEAFEVFTNELATRQVTGNAAITRVQEVLSQLDHRDLEVASRVLLKDLRCGVSIKTVNAAFGDDFIRDFEKHVMLAQPLNDKTVERIRFPAYVQRKMDGVRVNAFVDWSQEQVQYFTRKGQPIDLPQDTTFELNRELLQLVRELDWDDQMVIDGELLAFEDDEPMSRRKSNGIVNKGIKGTLGAFEADALSCIVWDAFPVVSFKQRVDKTDYFIRWGSLMQALHDLDVYKVLEVPTWFVSDLSEARQIAQEQIAQGHEGVVVKDPHGDWEGKRSYNMLKIKDVREGDFEVIDWQEHSKRPNELGALVCQSKDGKIVFNVGTGFSDEQRKQLTASDCVGSVAEVQFNEIIANDHDPNTYSLYLPSFVCLRVDKDRESTNTFEELAK